MTFVIGIDTGGTFTDTVVVEADGTRVTGKAGTTPDDPSEGIMESLDDAAATLGESVETVLPNTEVLFHGTTLTTNTVLERTGSSVGYLTTQGHRDTLHIGRTLTRTTGLTRDEEQHYASQSKPEPLVPKSRIREIDERIDYKGSEVVELDESGVEDAIDELADEVDAIAVNLLWSFENEAHESRIADIAEEVAPDTPVHLSHEISEKLGEYERGTTTVVNAYTAPVLEGYLEDLADRLQERGLNAPLYVMKSTGGAMPIEEAPNQAVATIMSGPTGGIIGSRHLGETIGTDNLICTDVGGTSFDAGLVIDGDLQTRPTSTVNKHTLYQLSVDIESIGSGGGSIAWIDEGGALRVGPKSAGADPGPACYGLGGEKPTVTDADLLLGYLDPKYFLGGRRELDVDAARTAMAKHVAEPLDMSVEEAAAGVFEIINGAMADLLRQVTVERGHDPRNFSILAYGGAGPLHAPFYGDDLDAKSIIVPLGDTASVFSAFGIATSDLLWVEEASNPSVEPFDPENVTETFQKLENRLREKYLGRGLDDDSVSITREVDLQYTEQVHQVTIEIPTGKLTDDAIEEVLQQWEEKYESLYGEGSTYAQMPIQLVNQRVIAEGSTTDPALDVVNEGDEDAWLDIREVYWPEEGFVETDIYTGNQLSVGDLVDGPAVIQLPDTTVTVRPHQEASVDEYRNIHIRGA